MVIQLDMDTEPACPEVGTAGGERWRQRGQGPWAGVLLSDEEAMRIIAVLADVLDGHDVRDAVSAA